MVMDRPALGVGFTPEEAFEEPQGPEQSPALARPQTPPEIEPLTETAFPGFIESAISKALYPGLSPEDRNFPILSAPLRVLEGAKLLAGMGLSDGLLRLAQTRLSAGDPAGGGFYDKGTLETGGLPLVELGPATSNPLSRDRRRLVAVHENLHAFEWYMTPEMREELKQIKLQFPPPDGTPSRHHPNEDNLTAWFDYSIDPAYLPGGRASTYHIPPEVLNFINRHLPAVQALAEQDRQSKFDEAGLPFLDTERSTVEAQRALLSADYDRAETTAMAEQGGLVPGPTGEFRLPANLREDLQRRRGEFSRTQSELEGIPFEESFLAREIPGASTLRRITGPLGRVIGGAIGAALPFAVGGAVPFGAAAPLLFGKETITDPVESAIQRFEAGGDIGEAFGEAVVPLHVWELGLELIPGIGLVPDLARLTQRLGRAGVVHLFAQAANNPQAGSPVYRYMVENGLAIGPDDLRRVLSEDVASTIESGGDVFFHGTTAGRAEEIRRSGLNPGSGLAKDREHAETFASTASRDAHAAGEKGAEPVILKVRAKQDELKAYTVPSRRLGRDVQEFYADRPLRIAGGVVSPEEIAFGAQPTGATSGMREIPRGVSEKALTRYKGFTESQIRAEVATTRRQIIDTRDEIDDLRHFVDSPPEGVSPEAIAEGRSERASAMRDLAGLNEHLRAGESILPPVVRPMAGAAPVPDDWAIYNEMIDSALERPEAQDFLRKVVAQNIERIPGLRSLLHLANRSAVAEEPYLKAALGWRMLEDWHASQLDLRLKQLALRRDGLPIKTRGAKALAAKEDRYAVEVLVRTKPPAAEAAKRGPTIIEGTVRPSEEVIQPGLVRREPGAVARPRPSGPPEGGFEEVTAVIRERRPAAWHALSDVFENPDDYDLPASVLDYIKESRSIMDEYAEEFLAVTGEDIRTRKRYWPRLVDKRAQPEVRGGFTGAGKPAPAQSRVFELMEDGLETGVPYRNDGLQEIYAYGRGLQRGIRNAIMERYLKQEGVLRPLARGERPFRAELYGSNIGFGTDTAINRMAALEIQKILGPTPGEVSGAIRVLNIISSVPRSILAGSMDFGQALLQTQALLFWNPRDVSGPLVGRGGARFLAGALTPPTPASVGRWAKANAQFFRVMFLGPDSFQRLQLRWAGSPVAQQYGLDLSIGTEFSEGLSFFPQAARIPTAPLRRTQEAFGAALATARYIGFDTLARLGSRTGAGPDEMYRIARASNAIAGQVSTRAMGQSEIQRAIEGAAVLFAPKYTRSAFGVLGYAAGKGFTPQQIRLLIAQTATWGAATMYGLNVAANMLQGMDTEEAFEKATDTLNPTKGKAFGSVKVGTGWYGIGGIYRASLEAIGGMSRMREWNDYLEQPEEVWKNPIIQHAYSYWRSRTAPATGSVVDFIDGEDFIGRGVDFSRFVDNPLDAAEYLGQKFLPLTMQAYLQAQGSDWQERIKNIQARPLEPQAVAQAALGAAGARTSPESAGEFLRRMRDSVAIERFGGQGVAVYDDLKFDPPARWEIRQDPRVQRALDRMSQEATQRETTPEDRFFERMDDIQVTYRTEQEKDDKALLGGGMDPRRWREEWMKRSIAKQATQEEAKKALGVTFEEETEPPEGTPAFAINAYFGVKLDEYIDPETREPDWDSFFAAREKVFQPLTAQDRRRVEAYIHKNLTPAQLEFRESQKVLDSSGYFKTRQAVAGALNVDLRELQDHASRQLTAAGGPATSVNVGKMVDAILGQKLLEIQALRYGLTVEGLQAASRRGEVKLLSIDNIKRAARETHPQIDAQLYRWGYDSCVRSTTAQQILQNGYDARLPAYFPAGLCEDVQRALKRGSP